MLSEFQHQIRWNYIGCLQPPWLAWNSQWKMFSSRASGKQSSPGGDKPGLRGRQPHFIWAPHFQHLAWRRCWSIPEAEELTRRHRGRRQADPQDETCSPQRQLEICHRLYKTHDLAKQETLENLHCTRHLLTVRIVLALVMICTFVSPYVTCVQNTVKNKMDKIPLWKGIEPNCPWKKVLSAAEKSSLLFYLQAKLHVKQLVRTCILYLFHRHDCGSTGLPHCAA